MLADMLDCRMMKGIFPIPVLEYIVRRRLEITCKLFERYVYETKRTKKHGLLTLFDWATHHAGQQCCGIGPSTSFFDREVQQGLKRLRKSSLGGVGYSKNHPSGVKQAAEKLK